MSADRWEAVSHLVRTEFAHGDEDKRGLLVAEVAPGFTDRTRLIATAPELLEALRPFANYACSPADQCECHNCRARDVIAKAEGTTP